MKTAIISKTPGKKTRLAKGGNAVSDQSVPNWQKKVELAKKLAKNLDLSLENRLLLLENQSGSSTADTEESMVLELLKALQSKEKTIRRLTNELSEKDKELEEMRTNQKK